VHGKPQTDVRREAVWNETREGQEADRAEKQRLLEQYRKEWGHYPQ